MFFVDNSLHSMRRTLIVLSLLCAGCLGNGARSSLNPRQVDVFGVAFAADTDYRELRGIKGVDEPCLRGFDRSFDDLDVVIGYDRKGRVRKITTRNPQTSLFGVHPGDTAASAAAALRVAGFVDDGTPSRFRNGGVALTVRADPAGRISGMTLETVDPDDGGN